MTTQREKDESTALNLAESILQAMRDGPLGMQSPKRSREIIAQALVEATAIGFKAGIEAAAKVCDDYRSSLDNDLQMARLAAYGCMERVLKLLPADGRGKGDSNG